MPSLFDTPSSSMFRIRRTMGLLDPGQEMPQDTPFGGGPRQAPLNPYNLFKPFDPGAAPPNAQGQAPSGGQSLLDMPAPTRGQGNGSMVQPPPSMSDNIGHGIRSLLGADTMPAGYDALFSKADLKATKQNIPHLLANWMFGQFAGDETKANLEQIDKMREVVSGRAMQKKKDEMGLLMDQAKMGDVNAQAALRTSQSEQGTYLQSPEFAKDLTDARGGDKAAVARVTQRLVGHPAAGAILQTIVPKNVPDKQYEPKPWKLKDGRYVQIAPGDPVPDGAVPASMAQTQVTVQGATDRAATMMTQRRTQQFQRDIKPLTDRATMIQQAIVTMTDAANTQDPEQQRTLYSSAIANFVQAADQKVQLRQQMLNFFKSNVDASIGGKWEVLKDRLLSGTLPAYSMQAMLKHLNTLKGLIGTEISQRRSALVARHPNLDGELPDANDFLSGAMDSAEGGSDYDRAYRALGSRATDAAIDAWIKANPKK